MLHLAADTPPAWVSMAVDHVDLLLLDHAHCEKKAASTAINLIFRYPDHDQLVRTMTDLAREELDHFEQALDRLKARGVPFRRLEPSPYAGRLMRSVRRAEPHRLIDTLLCCALIEARSCERMKLLSEHLDDAELASWYAGLLASEARHHHVYVDLAIQLDSREAVFSRLSELAEAEAEIVRDADAELRMHS